MTQILRSCIFFLAVVVAGCSDHRFDADVSNIEYRAEFERLDKAVFALDRDEPLPGYRALLEKHDVIFVDYVEDIMRTGEASNPMTAALLMRFTEERVWSGLQEHIESVFPQLTPFEQELRNGLKRFAYFFNENQLPRLAAYNSGYNVGIYPSDEWLGVGLEWYAGTDHKYVNQLPPDLFPQYKRDKMQPQFMVPNALRGWLLYRFREKSGGENLLSELIFAGKVTYLTEVLLELDGEQRVLNFTDPQMQWSYDNEYDVWKNLVERDMIFSNDRMEINKLMNDGPFTPGMPQESPGGVGKWIGYRMVKAFMDNNPELTLPGLMAVDDGRRILKYYKPGR